MPLIPVAVEDTLRAGAGATGGASCSCRTCFTGSGGAFDVDPRTSSLRPVPDIDAAPASYSILAWAMEPGDCLVFQPRVLHGNAGTRASTRSRRVSLHWVAEDAVYVEKPLSWTTFGQDHGLKSGQRILGEKFPLVWTRRDGLLGNPALDE